ncbi:EAL domain-containing protein [Sulfurimonas sp. SAG-AH-194-I05]|nr:GGDEF and EAL domain-containing protein [Sulfurimonas sp. SAG-AH-194-I05]MDF1874748.1 EAL domain-containing protein [Sulfurimonas sp. SAG-AH-194-I05]
MPFSIEDLQEHNEELLKLLTQHLPDMLWVKDLNGLYLYANKAICDGLLMAKDIQEPIGKGDVFFALRERELHKDEPQWHTFGELCFNSDQDVIDKNKAMKFEEYGNVKGKLMYLEVYKAPFYDARGKIIGTVGAGRDITKLKKTHLDLEKSLQKLDKQKKALEYQSSHDSLTSLPNRIDFTRELTENLHFANNHENTLAILFIDLDNFKEINDSLGHTIGDKVLIEVTTRIKNKMQTSAFLARLGGDEFGIILKGMITQEEVSLFADVLIAILKEPLQIGNYTLYTSMSIGISMFGDDGDTATILLKNADAAMYEAKKNGRNCFYFYNKKMTESALERVFLETSLRQALKEDAFVVYFQPQINAQTNTFVGMEALVRWNHPSLGIIAPDTFIPLAETTGMIIELDRIVITKAMTQFKKWEDAGLNPGKLSLNLAMKQIESDDFLEYLDALSLKLNYSYSSLEFEVTESQIMNNPQESIKMLQSIHNLGISISIDDFGTGYSSLAYLKHLPIHKLKIDKSFVDYLPQNVEDSAICKTIISLCENLNLEVIAEGIETKEQRDFMLENGCHLIQGYLYSRPLDEDAMLAYLKNRLL